MQRNGILTIDKITIELENHKPKNTSELDKKLISKFKKVSLSNKENIERSWEDTLK